MLSKYFSVKFIAFTTITILVLVIFVIIINRPAEEEDYDNYVVENNVIPDLMPVDFPQYGNASIINSWQTQTGKGMGLSVLLETEDGVETVAKYYKNELDANGWDANIIKEEAQSVIISFSKGKYSGPLGITKSDSGSVLVSVTIGIKE